MNIILLLWQKLLNISPAEAQANPPHMLLNAKLHMPLLTQRRALMIMKRIRVFALLLAFLTPAWAAIDYFTLPYPLWLQLVSLRFVASVVFLTFVFWQRQSEHLSSMYRSMLVLFTIPITFYLSAHLLLQSYPSTLPLSIYASYAFLPFLLLTGLAVFPLTLLESLFFATPVILGFIFAKILEFALQSTVIPFGAELWLLIVLAGVVTTVSLSQLAFIITLIKQAIRDPLTGILSRHSGEEMLGLFLSQSKRSDQPLSVAFLDLDHFKGINDQFGHLVGDRLLCQFVDNIKKQLRPSDVLMRWGGEEFALLMPGASLGQAEQIMQRLRSHNTCQRPDGKALTVSIGLAELHQDQCQSWRALVDKADARMYLAKEAGRDTIVLKG